MNKNEWNRMRLEIYKKFITQKYGEEKEQQLELAISSRGIEDKLLEYRNSEQLCHDLNEILFDEN